MWAAAGIVSNTECVCSSTECAGCESHRDLTTGACGKGSRAHRASAAGNIIRQMRGNAGDAERNDLTVRKRDFFYGAGCTQHLIPERQAGWGQNNLLGDGSNRSDASEAHKNRKSATGVERRVHKETSNFKRSKMSLRSRGPPDIPTAVGIDQQLSTLFLELLVRVTAERWDTLGNDVSPNAMKCNFRLLTDCKEEW